MFMELIPTWEVIIHPDDEKARRRFRVPESSLMEFLNVVTFNGIEDFRVIREDKP